MKLWKIINEKCIRTGEFVRIQVSNRQVFHYTIYSPYLCKTWPNALKPKNLTEEILGISRLSLMKASNWSNLNNSLAVLRHISWHQYLAQKLIQNKTELLYLAIQYCRFDEYTYYFVVKGVGSNFISPRPVALSKSTVVNIYKGR